MRTLIGLLLILAVAACHVPSTAENESLREKAVPVGTVRLKTSDFTEYGEYYGRVSGIAEATLITVAGGLVESISGETGDTVRVGRSLGKINARKAKMAFEVARVNAKIARENYERAVTLLESGNTAQVTVDRSHLSWLQAEDLLLDAERVLTGALCLTPIDGIVLSRYIELHEQTSPASPTFTIAQIDSLRITIGIPEHRRAVRSAANPVGRPGARSTQKHTSGILLQAERNAFDIVGAEKAHGPEHS